MGFLDSARIIAAGHAWFPGENQAGLAVAADGGIPVFHHAYDGGAGEVAQVTGAMTALKKIAGPRAFLLVGDSKLISWGNATAMAAGQVAFVAPLAASRVPAGLFAALPAGSGTEVDYVAGRDAGKPAAARGTYRVLEDDGMGIRGPRKSDPVVHLRRILVYSSANAAGQAKARALKLARAATELDKLVRTAGTRFHPTDDAVAARVQAIAAKRRVGRYLRTAITAGPAGKPVLSWHFDQDAIDTEAAADGWYALLTNLTSGQAGPAEVFRMHDSGDYNIAEIAVLSSVSRPTVYRSLERTTELPPLPADTRPEPDIATYDQLLTRRPD